MPPLSIIALVVGTFTISLGIYQLIRFCYIIENGIEVRAKVTDTYLNNDSDKCPIVTFHYNEKEVTIKLNDTCHSLGHQEQFTCLYDPQNNILEYRPHTRMPIPIIGLFLLGTSFLWVAFNT